MTQYFYGENAYAARQAIAELAKDKSAQVRWLDRDELERRGVKACLESGRGLFGQDLLVLRDVSALPKSLQEDILDYLKDNDSLCVLWDRVVPDKRTTLWRQLKDKGRDFGEPDQGAQVRWIGQEAVRQGGEITSSAARELVGRLGTDSWRLVNELTKLLTLGEVVTKEMVEEQVVSRESDDVFKMLDALAMGKKPAVIRSVLNLLAEGNSEWYLLSMLAYQFRTLLMVRRGLDAGQSSGEIARGARIQPFVVEKNLAGAKRFDQDYLRDGLTRILATDFAIKRGRVDARTGLLMLVLSLAR